MPPRTHPGWYQPVGRIVLPADTRFVAGFVHEGLGFDDNRRVLDAVEAARRSVVDVSSSCGLGRRTEAVAAQLLEWTARLCDD